MKKKPEPDSDLILYLTEDGRTRLQVRLEGETVWLSLNQMVDLFQRDKSVISRHIKNVFEEGELVRDSVVAECATTAADGKIYQVEFYNLDVIISVGYRVKSRRGTQFRIWATQRLREYIVKGFAMDDERLKNPPGKGHIDYFDELLERIRDIRSSERRVYLRVREILALAADYEPTEPETQVFFQTIQNKLHFAATGKTAAELIAERADSSQPNMGLMAWRTGVVRKGDVTIAKNYLREDEIEELNRIVVMFLDFAEDQARRKKQVFLQNWVTRMHDFLNLNERAILADAGKVSREEAHALAEAEYERYAARRRAALEAQGEADLLGLLDAEVKKLPKSNKPKRPHRSPRGKRNDHIQNPPSC